MCQGQREMWLISFIIQITCCFSWNTTVLLEHTENEAPHFSRTLSLFFFFLFFFWRTGGMGSLTHNTQFRCSGLSLRLRKMEQWLFNTYLGTGQGVSSSILEIRVSCHLKVQEVFTVRGKVQSRPTLNKPFPLLQHTMFHLWIELRIWLFLTLVSSSSLFLAWIISSKSFLLRLSSSIKAWCCNNTIPKIIKGPL